VSLLYCVSSVFYFFICFILFLCDPVFLTTGIRVKGNSQEKRFLVRVGEMTEDGKFKVEKFNGQNYQLWKMQMEYYLYHKDLFRIPLGRITNKPTTMKDEEWEVLDRKALGTIWLCLQRQWLSIFQKKRQQKI
jgi:hypothetical protein